MEHVLDHSFLHRPQGDPQRIGLKTALAASFVVIATFSAAITTWFTLPGVDAGSRPTLTAPKSGTRLSSRGMETIPCAGRWTFQTDHWVCSHAKK
jgi:hypothetical protein